MEIMKLRSNKMAEVSLSEETKIETNPYSAPLPFLTTKGDMVITNKKNYPLKVGMVINFQNVDMVVDYINIGKNFINLTCKNVSVFEVGSKHMHNGIEYEVIKIDGNKITIKTI
jgi:hypothetical protein